MDKLIRVALATKFSEENIDNILRVIGATGNKSVATEILLGIYDEPNIRTVGGSSETAAERLLLSYCPFSDTVKYSYYRVSVEKAWFAKGTKDINLDDAVSRNSYSSIAAKENGMCVDEFEDRYEYLVYKSKKNERTSTGSCSLSQWNTYCNKYEAWCAELDKLMEKDAFIKETI